MQRSLARAELETESTDPLAVLPPPGTTDYELILLVWPVVTFLVICSILVHGSSIAVFTLGKRINTLTLTLSYTQDNESGPSWMNRLQEYPRSLDRCQSWKLHLLTPQKSLSFHRNIPSLRISFVSRRKKTTHLGLRV